MHQKSPRIAASTAPSRLLRVAVRSCGTLEVERGSRLFWPRYRFRDRIAVNNGGFAQRPLGLLTKAYACGNHLLDALPRSDRADLEADLEIINVTAHSLTHAVGATITHVDFPINAVLSVVATFENGDTVEVGTVGSESFVQADAALSTPLSQRTSFCQVRGSVGRMSIRRFEKRMADSSSFALYMRRNVSASLFSAQQFAACNAKHSVLQRCARWLAMTEDRVGSGEFVLTHEFLAIMMGVRRASVSDSADALQKRGAISYQRGKVKVLDDRLLRQAACECYGACKRAFELSLVE
jgi:CRP-like cAMP-binding protein